MNLDGIKVEGFKKVLIAELRLADLNILVGSNGCGKSSIIQAVHLGCCMIRQAERVDSRSSTVGIDSLDYLPTNNYPSLGHNGYWGNKDGSASSKVELSFSDPARSLTASCSLRSARNAGISIRGSVPAILSERLRTSSKFFSAYIPGISGIPNKEEKRSEKVILKACSYGDSNIFLRNVLHLLSQRDPQNIRQIEIWIGEIAGRVGISVNHEDRQDLTIRCDVTTPGAIAVSRPIELLGTGYLQLIQIFAYILLFAPGILLIDEPDIHLHPSVQERLVRVLARVAGERQFKILLTTHSPFMVRGAPVDANVYWIDEGRVENAHRSQVELALGWGAFGKKIILVSEDQNSQLLKRIIAQWPHLERNIAFLPGRGYKSVTTPEQASEMAEALGGRYKVLVHRDRDSLTDSEVVGIQAKYSAKGATIWFTELSDIEAYFCLPGFLQSFLGCSQADAIAHVDSVLQRFGTPISEQFTAHRAAHNQELYPTGGSPTNSDVWNTFQGRALKGAKGKFVFNQLKNSIAGNTFRVDTILKHSPVTEIAPDLKRVLESLST